MPASGALRTGLDARLRGHDDFAAGLVSRSFSPGWRFDSIAGPVTSSPPMLSERGRTSPSFLLAILLLVVGVGGYGAWRLFKPDPYRQSEQVVRDSRQALNIIVSDFRRKLGAVMDKKDTAPAERVAEVEKLGQEAELRIDEYLDDARQELSELDIALRTHKNRSDRLVAKADDAKAMVKEGVEHAKARIGGG